MHIKTPLLIPLSVDSVLSRYSFWLFVLLCFFYASPVNASGERQMMNLSGEWICSLDSDNQGENNGWGIRFPEAAIAPVILPGSLDSNGIGYSVEEKSDQHLGKPLQYEGAAWYTKTVTLPDSFRSQYVELLMERTKVTKVWINGQYAGGSDLVYAPQTLDVSELIRPGQPNTITVCVNNELALVPVEGSHAYSPDTQTNWNGIIGKICLTAMAPEHILAVRVYPNVPQKSFHLEVELSHGSADEILYLRAQACLISTDEGWSDYTYTKVSGSSSIEEIMMSLGSNAEVWSDTSPSLYKVRVELGIKDATGGWSNLDAKEWVTGLREFKATPDGFTINGNRTFLRGKHDACVFPLTGYPPMTLEGWMREFGIAKTYGINHYRFHTFTPPDAAFEAADRLGIYIQSELPVWWAFDDKDESQVSYMKNLGTHIADAYANHPSFVMFALGNEIYQDRAVLKEMVAHLRAHDPRPLYSQGSNNRLWDPSFAEGDDYWRSFRTGSYQEGGLTDARLSMSYIDSNGEGGQLNFRYPSTTINFDKALERSPVPFLGFEVGQYQVFPNFSELTKYTGVLKPYNLEQYRDRLKKTGMLDQAQDFFLASGALSVLCYRADIEAMLRTERYAGFDLLDLQDYPGQGTALVGMLDAFMDSKGLIRPDEFRQFCDETVILLEQEKFCWTNDETYTAAVSLSNFSNQDFQNRKIEWQLRDGGHLLKSGSVVIDSPSYSGLKTFEQAISFPLNGISTPIRLDLDLFLVGTSIRNSYPLWIYPESKTVEDFWNVLVVESLDYETMQYLEDGGKVLLFPTEEGIKKHSTANQFISEFWNWQMFTKFAIESNKPISAGTMGLLLNPRHKAVADFPTDFHTDYQWWPIVTYSRALILDDFPNDYRPIIQVVDNISRMHKLGLLCEFKVGKGKLLICTSRLPDHMEYPEVRQFYISLVNYMKSEDFAPDYEIKAEELKALGM